MSAGTGTHKTAGAGVNAVKTALHTRIVAALAAAGEDEVDAAFGFRWPAQWDDTIAVTAVRATPQEDTLGPQRRRQVDVQVDVNIVSYRVTDDEKVTHDRAFGLLDVVDQAMRAEPTLGGVALWCFCGEVQSDGATAEDDAGEGRVTEIAATYEARIIVSS
ncbi:S8/S53 family peptidase [Cellulomonas timonensis]|uniref:hypothetical protein n=1 Tax=Cellulomonas timonensis TaxID=1689271 RepID=UPI0008325E1A|nr:hypothetical protein [Cellulomonas timonensis]